MADRTTFTDYETKISAEWLNAVDATVVGALGGTEDPAGAIAHLGAVPEAPIDGTQYLRINAAWSEIVFPPLSHTQLSDKEAADQHPVSSINGLEDALADADRLTTGSVDAALMGDGTPTALKFLRGDKTWALPPGGGGLGFLPGTSLDWDENASTLHNPSDTGGFENRTSSSLVFGSNQFTLTRISDFRVWSASAVFEYTANEVVAVPNATAFYFLSINSVGDLECSTTPWEITDAEAPVATLYFNATYPTEYVLTDERHSSKRNMIAHRIAHKTQGAYIDLPGDLVGTFGDTNGSISIGSGSFYDEDLKHVIEAAISQAKTIYKDTSGWRVGTLASDYRKLNSGVLRYNNGTALADVTLNNYTNYWVYAVPAVVGAADATGEIHALVGQVLHATPAAAMAETVDTLTLPPWISNEARALYRVTLQRTAATPAGNIYQLPTDLRFTKISGGVTVSGAYLPTSLPEGNLWVGNASGVAAATTVVASGTAVAASPVLTLTQTWNNAAVAFQGLQVAITDTASLAASLLLDLKVGGATKTAITKGGGLQSYGVTGTNYERGVLDWETTANVLTVGAQKAGTGTLRDLNLVGKNVGINTQDGALATTATSGFFLMGSCAGTPTGVPAGVPTGMTPVVVDSTTGQLYIYTP